MKKIIKGIILVFILIVSIIYRNEIIHHITVNYIYKKDIVEQTPNIYKLDYNFHYLKETENFFPKNKADLFNVLYTILNNGYDEFTFFCDIKYNDCIKDISNISTDTELLSTLNNFVHPFNTYNVIYIDYNQLGKITVQFEKLYQENEINTLNKNVNEIYNKLITTEMNDKDKILKIHDYIINTTTYDQERAAAIVNNDANYVPLYQSHKAVGPLLQNKGICGGYSDAMSLFLFKLNIPNLRISNETHIWNLVKLDNKWYHLDLTWDDPVTINNEDLLLHDYFLIDGQQLKKINNNHHFSKDIYVEAIQ